MPVHLLLFIFYGSDGITHKFPVFKGVRELTFRQIDQNIIFGWWFIPIMAILCVLYLRKRLFCLAVWGYPDSI
jgi:hypothetical protein